MMKNMLNFLVFIAVAYLVLVGVIYAFQRQLMYHPGRDVGVPSQYNLHDFSEHFIATPDGETIQLWHHAATAGFPTVIYYHGNAYTLGDRAGIYGALADKGFGVLALSYRGYGKSTGTISEQGLYIDARTAIRYATDTLHLPLSQIVLFGESLGTGIAVQMGTEFGVGAVALQAPYTSIETRAAEIYRFVPVRFLIKDRYDTLSKIAHIQSPLLVFHGERDEVIPVAHGRAVFATARDPKESVFFHDIHHNDFDSRVISEHLYHFTQKYKLIAQ
jgi:uncharacterized protein